MNHKFLKNDWMTYENFFRCDYGHFIAGKDMFHVPSERIIENFRGIGNSVSVELEVITPSGPMLRQDLDYSECGQDTWVSVKVPTDECLWRFPDKKVEKLRQLVEVLEVGDFVRIVGLHGTRPWRKIIELDTQEFRFLGQSSSKSDNSNLTKRTAWYNMGNITKLVKGTQKTSNFG